MAIADLSPSDFIVYVDESGDHSLATINPRYPVFVLSFCIFRKEYYSHIVTPRVRMLKFATFGHDMVVLHEHEIRKKIGSFKLLNKEPRESFLQKLSLLIENIDFFLLPVVIDKRKINHPDIHGSPLHVYHLAMRLGLENLYRFLQHQGQKNLLTHVIFESRGQVENAALEDEFHQVCDGNNIFQEPMPLEIVVADKKTNSEGLQIADMVARPIGLSILRPQQPNRAVEILEKKFYRNREGLSERDLILYP